MRTAPVSVAMAPAALRATAVAGLVRVLGTALVTALVLLAGPGPALAEPPVRAADEITDEVGALEGEQSRVQAALDRLRDADGTQLFVVFVASFDGLDGQAWADQSAQQSQLGARDVLFAVAVEDRAYGLSVDQDFPVSAEDLDDLVATDVEPLLAREDWAGAAIAFADGLRGEESAGGSGLAIALLLGGLVVAGGGYVLYRRRRAARTRAEPATPGSLGPPGSPPDPHAGTSTDQLTFQASTALIDLDDAAQTSAQELTFARGQFGDEAVVGFQQALDASRAELGQGFGLRQRLDDEVPEDEATRRRMLGEILALCASADQRLDDQSEAFDRLRDLDQNAPQVLEALAPRLAAARTRVPREEARLAAMQKHYAATALAETADNLEHARALLGSAATELDEARAALASPNPSAAVVSLRTAEDATAAAETLLDGLARLEAELGEAGARIAAARAETDRDLAEAGSLLASHDPPGLAQIVARAEAGVTAADAAMALSAESLPDPLAALRSLTEADLALDEALATARDTAARTRRVEVDLEQALVTARSSLAAAGDFIATRRAAVGAQARTRLAEGHRHLDAAMTLATTDPAGALREAQHADALGVQALRSARTDTDRYSDGDGAGFGGGGFTGRGYGRPGYGGSGPNLGALVLGGILFGGGRGGGFGSGGLGRGFGGGGAGGGRRSTGSFGGSRSRGRRGGGGRF